MSLSLRLREYIAAAFSGIWILTPAAARGSGPSSPRRAIFDRPPRRDQGD
jgi:hypothetical protein